MFGYLTALTLAARISSFNALGQEAADRNSSGWSNTTGLLTGSGSNAECHIQGKHLRLVYEAQGDDVKPTPFNALLVYAFGVYVEGAELYGWDTGVGTRPLQLAKNDYWLVFDELSSREQATWMNMIRVLAVIEHCYSIGHVQEFVAKIMIEGRRVATGRLFFKRDHRSVNSMF